MDAEDAAGAAELVVDGAEVDLPDAKLAQQGGAHDAGLDGDVEDALGHDAAVDDGGRVQLLAVGEDVAVAGVDVAPAGVV